MAHPPAVAPPTDRWGLYLSAEEAADLVASFEGMMLNGARYVVRDATRVFSNPHIGLWHLTEEAYGAIRVRYVLATRTFNPHLGFKLSSYTHRNAVHEARQVVDRELRRGVHVPVYLKSETPISSVATINPPEDGGHADHALWDEPAVDTSDSLDKVEKADVDLWKVVRMVLTDEEWSLVEGRFLLGLPWKRACERVNRSHEYYRAVMDRVTRKLKPVLESLGLP